MYKSPILYYVTHYIILYKIMYIDSLFQLLSLMSAL